MTITENSFSAQHDNPIEAGETLCDYLNDTYGGLTTIATLYQIMYDRAYFSNKAYNEAPFSLKWAIIVAMVTCFITSSLMTL